MEDKINGLELTPDQIDDLYYSISNIIISQLKANVQYKFKVYKKLDFNNLPKFQYKFKEYEVPILPNENEKLDIIWEPKYYITTRYTKIKYLENFDEFYRRCMSKLEQIKSGNDSRFENRVNFQGLYEELLSRGDDELISQFWEDNWEYYDGDWVEIYSEWNGQLPARMKSIADKYHDSELERILGELYD